MTKTALIVKTFKANVIIASTLATAKQRTRNLYSPTTADLRSQSIFRLLAIVRSFRL